MQQTTIGAAFVAWNSPDGKTRLEIWCALYDSWADKCARLLAHVISLCLAVNVRLLCRDTAGQERYATLAPMYYRCVPLRIAHCLELLSGSWAWIDRQCVHSVPGHDQEIFVVSLRGCGLPEGRTGACRNAAGILVVYDMTDRASFDRAIRWLTELPSTMPADTVLVLVGAPLACLLPDLAFFD